MALTKEERKQRAQQRERERHDRQKELEQSYGSARFSTWKEDCREFLQLRLDPENPFWLAIRYLGDSWFTPEYDCEDVKTASIPLDNPCELATLIRALVLRYNAITRELNATVSSTPAVERAKTLPPNGIESVSYHDAMICANDPAAGTAR